MADILSVHDLKKHYPDGTEAVKGVTFQVKKGEIFGILGPNGAGKTTTLEMTEGKATLDGIDVGSRPDDVKEIIGVQPQSSAFLDGLKLKELLVAFASMYGVRTDVNGLLTKVELQSKADAYPEHLSGGQRQRFSIAVALVHQPKVLFLDEPTTGLDPQARRNLWDLVQAISKDGVTVIMTTHYMEEAQVLCDRVAVMDEGKIIALDTPADLIKQLLDRGFKPHVEVQAASLEDVFIDLTGKAIRD
jgi:ABC-2 type transport system ATP-binding protein